MISDPSSTVVGAMSSSSASSSSTFDYRPATVDDVPRCHALESVSYPEDEAATLDSLTYRQRRAGAFFLVRSGDVDGDVEGFVCGTRCRVLDHDSMTTHDPNGPWLAIHSVVVAPERRRRGVATAMLKEYLRRVEENKEQETDVEGVVLLAKKHLLSFYVDCGFYVTRRSDVVHGQDAWYELRYDVARKRRRRYFVVDSFASSLLSSSSDAAYRGDGNPAAVVLGRPGESPPTDLEPLRRLAREFNLSETAFVWDNDDDHDGDHDFVIKFLTASGAEVDLCGHATLAAAAALARERGVARTRFRANRGATLEAVVDASGRVRMDFPRNDVVPLPSSDDEETARATLRASLGTTDDDVVALGASRDGDDLFVELAPEAFGNLPDADGVDYRALTNYPGPPSRGVIVCRRGAAADDDDVDFCSRFFGPKVGIEEDPVTGSAHCTLGPYFAEKLGKTRVVGRQASARGGVVECVLDDEDRDRITIVGDATIVAEGTLLV